MFSHRYTQRVLVAAVVVSTWLVWPPSALAQESDWVLRVQGTWTNPTSVFNTLGQEGEAISAESNAQLGFAATLEYRIDPRFGVEFGGGYSRPSIDVSVELDGRARSLAAATRFTPLTAGLNLHVAPGRTLDVYGGVMVVAGFFGNLTLEVEDDTALLRSHADLGFGLQAGVDVPLGRRGWAFNAIVRYMRVDYNVTDSDSDNDYAMHFNPFVAGFGISARF